MEREATDRRAGEMLLHERISSRGRFWSGVSATLFDTTPGFAEQRDFPTHMLSMHLGPPVVATAYCDGASLRRVRYQGDIHVVPAGYSGAWLNEGPASELVLNVSPSFLHSVAEDRGIDAGCVRILPSLQMRDPRLEYIGLALLADLQDEAPAGALFGEGLGLALAAHLLRGEASRIAPPQTCLSKRRLRLVTDYIRENLSHDLTIDELAAVAHVSPSHFRALFKASTGLPVHQYVLRRRVDRVVQLLRDPAVALSAIAPQCGFANQSHMARFVRRFTGESPARLRSQL